ncbi:MAG TPA: alternative oxidase [Acidimicrobiales bacterium]|nr:alternative oxidase [Acidimicrobiales bacterium]
MEETPARDGSGAGTAEQGGAAAGGVATVRPPLLDHDALVQAQLDTLASPRRHYGLASRVLFAALDVVYGPQRSLSKFKVLELVARVPYQSWEQVAYIAITHAHERQGLARRIHDRVVESRSQQDNEAWHLVVIGELVRDGGVRETWLKYRLVPQFIAFAYYQVSFALFVLRPDWSYRLNADFEDHAEHEYMQLVAEHPEWETEPYESGIAAEYGTFASKADLFRQIGHDERVHKLESVARMGAPRFS